MFGINWRGFLKTTVNWALSWNKEMGKFDKKNAKEEINYGVAFGVI